MAERREDQMTLMPPNEISVWDRCGLNPARFGYAVGALKGSSPNDTAG